MYVADPWRYAPFYVEQAHGVRKIGATHAANNGATVAELEAIFGWTGGRMDTRDKAAEVDGLKSEIYVNMFDAHKLLTASAQTPQNFHLHNIGLHQSSRSCSERCNVINGSSRAGRGTNLSSLRVVPRTRRRSGSIRNSASSATG